MSRLHPLLCAAALSLGLSACDEESGPRTDVDAQSLDAGPADTSVGDLGAPEEDAAPHVEDATPPEEDAAPPAPALRALFDPQLEDFYGTPWPSDARLTAQGTPELVHFPTRSATLRAILDELQGHIYGFASMAVVYLPFEGDLAAVELPSPAESRLPSSPVQLIALDTCAPVPIDLYVEPTGDRYLPAQTLALKNAIGTVLRPGVPHAALALRSLGAPEGPKAEPDAAFEAALRGDGSAWDHSFEPLRACLPALGLSPGALAVATVFTPQDPAEELERLHGAMLDAEALPSRAPENLRTDWAWSRRRLQIRTLSGHLPMPIFQQGTPPYQTEGGGFVFDDAGQPLVQRWEPVPFALSWRDRPELNTQPRPVLVFIDGTGWDRWGHLSSGWLNMALDEGFLIASFMPQFHGGRADFTGAPELPSFNFLNPPAGRSNFRQQAVENVYFARALQEQIAPLGGLPAADWARPVYGGHSQGALVGALTAAITDRFVAYVFNGLSSYLSLTILHRKDLLDFELMARNLMGNPGPLHPFSPSLALMQQGSESVDPHNFARRWRGWPAHPQGNSVFVINGREDDTTTPRGIDHLTLSADLPLIDPPGWAIDEQDLFEPTAQRLPLSGNAQALSGAPLTLATYLKAEGDHFTIYRDPALQRMSLDFWLSALAGGPPVLQTDSELFCDNGLDDDGDGFIDCNDPDCANDGHCRELKCDDEIDNDNDGLTDCDDPDCANSSVCRARYCEALGEQLCEDARCQNLEACRELKCDDGLDNDGDGLTDCDDPDCANNGACRELKCTDGLDNDDDGLTDCEDPDCYNHPSCPEIDCTDGLDNDGNGLADCEDPRCMADEACAREVELLCDDGLDDDGDGLTDCDDPDCAPDPACAPVEPCVDADLGSTVGLALLRTTLHGRGTHWPPGDCTALGTGEDAPDFAVAFTAPQAGRYRFITFGSTADTVLTAFEGVCPQAPEPGDELACQDDAPGTQTSQLDLELTEGQRVLIVIASYGPVRSAEQGEVVLSVLTP